MKRFEEEAKSHRLVPGYLRLAWEDASPSLKRVVSALSADIADCLVFDAYMTRGRRTIIEVESLLAHFDPLIAESADVQEG